MKDNQTRNITNTKICISKQLKVKRVDLILQ